MYKKIETLYRTAYQMSRGYLVEQERNGVGLVKKMFPQIQEFILWFLKENIFGIETELYLEMQNYLLQVLEDIIYGIKQNDRVLLHDAVAYGLMEYLKMFIDVNQEEQKNDNL